MNMHIATALIVQRTALECLRVGIPLSSATAHMQLEYRKFTASADADHLIASDLSTIYRELKQLGFDIK